jgi:quaternary ammonium compound-resistance protein SugE
MAWLYLLTAGLFEIGWPIGLKIAQNAEQRWLGVALSVASLTLSGYLLWLAQRVIPMGTAYAVWTGIGAAGTFFVGVLFFGDASNLGRYLGVLLIVSGVITLKLTAP